MLVGSGGDAGGLPGGDIEAGGGAEPLAPVLVAALVEALASVLAPAFASPIALIALFAWKISAADRCRLRASRRRWRRWCWALAALV